MSRGAFAGNKGQGSKWIRKNKRLGIYERDGYKCVWCQAQLRAGRAGECGGTPDLATLDHLVPRASGGTNDASNLVTSCADCNSRRGDTSAIEFAHTFDDWYAVLERVLASTSTPVVLGVTRKVAA